MYVNIIVTLIEGIMPKLSYISLDLLIQLINLSKFLQDIFKSWPFFYTEIVVHMFYFQ